MRPAGEGAAGEQTVVADAVFFVHARSRRECETAGGRRTFGPFAAGIVEFVPVPETFRRKGGKAATPAVTWPGPRGGGKAYRRRGEVGRLSYCAWRKKYAKRGIEEMTDRVPVGGGKRPS